MTLPSCLTKFDAAELMANEILPSRYVEAIVSRPRKAMVLYGQTIGVWAAVPPVRCVMSRDAITEYSARSFLICILREFDEFPQ